MENSGVSIIIPTKNDGENIERCLKSIQRLDYSGNEYEVIIVDGHSTDKTVEVAKRYGCKIVYENIGTIGGARNVGVNNSHGKYVVFTDADCVVEKNWLNNLIGILQVSDAASVGGPNITPEDDTGLAKCVGTVLSFLSKPGARYGFNADEAMEIYHNPTCNVAYKKEAFLKARGFNEKLISCDDEELDFRLRKMGYKIFFSPNARVLHYRRSTWRKFVKMAFNYGVGRIQAIRLHRKMGKYYHYIPTILIMLLTFLFVFSMLTPVSLTPLLISLIGGVALGMVTSLHLAIKERMNFVVLFVLISIWLLGYGFGMLKGLFK